MAGPVSLRFLVSSALSLLGNSVAGVILPLVLLATTGDPLAAGALALITMIPQALAGVAGGALVDRLNRCDVSVVSDLISAASVAMLPVIDATVGLNFGWFVLFGLLGAVGDVPGMTARDSLLPAVCERDGVSMQRFVGLQQSVESLMTIVGPAVAALCMGLAGATNALVITACTSAAAAFITLTVPRGVGKVPSRENREPHPVRMALRSTKDGLRTLFAGSPVIRMSVLLSMCVRMALRSTKDGLRTLFAGSPVIRMSVLLSMCVLMVIGGYQGLILPVHFTLGDRADLLGYVLTVMSAGVLAASLIYAKLASKLSNRTWYSLSLVGMMAGIAIMATLPSYPVLLAGAALLGFASGPLSALLNFKVFDLIPDEVRGATLGTQNALMLVVAPVAVFIASVLVAWLGVGLAAIVLAGLWAAFTLYALLSSSMREL
ncbi:MFS transporter [Slackia equolifaciens]|uniref:MFS transporter n=2 Tax=Slackia equolifaciens TaxID=498718 RepID=A0A3N0B0G9_9ACTN|nr:MFS transporter [Slackia equolifaciens]